MKFDATQFKKDFEQGCVFAYPTEAVYGLGCDPINASAMDNILSLKQRPIEKGVILIAGDVKELSGFIEISLLSKEAMQRIEETWPGPFTWLVPKGPKTPNWISGGSDLVAVRITTHELVRDMCKSVSSPLVSTSANIGGMPPARTQQEVIDYFSSQVKLIDGQLGNQAKPSAIINAITMERIR
ncbi:MAG: Sua5/YciO/YrdC/YwlC family protein [Pseudomonadota bacterium]